MARNGGRSPAPSDGLREWLFRPIDIASIVYFRIVFGTMMVFQIVHEFSSGNVENIYIKPRLHFSYLGFGWLEPLPADLMVALLAGLAVLGVCIAIGLWYRITTTLFFLGFTYLFLLDKAAYQNHLYLICLISFLMILIPANRAASVDAWHGWVKKADTLPAWMLSILLFQIGVVYFFGGIAKINPDWLQGQPIGLWLSRRADWPLIGPFVHDVWFVGIFAYGGLLLDLLIVPALLWKKTRPYAFVVAVLFHLTNDWIFNIGIFPWLMIFATALFFEPDWPRRLVGELRRSKPNKKRPRKRSKSKLVVHTRRNQRGIAAMIALYVVFQLVMPLRQYLYPGDANWTEEGHYFSWHMMLRYKEIDQQQILVKDAGSQRTWQIRLRDYVEYWQARNMLGSPDMLLQFSHYIADQKREEGVANPQVFALVSVSLNGRRPQQLVDPGVDLAAQPRTLSHKKWVLPLEQELSHL